MKDVFIIKAKRPFSPTAEYLTTFNRWTTNPNAAKEFIERSLLYANVIVRSLPDEYNAEIVPLINEIGTYISTRSRKHTLKNYLNNILIVLLIPILLPFVGLTKCYHCLKYITK